MMGIKLQTDFRKLLGFVEITFARFYSFSVAALTTYHKPLKTTQMYCLMVPIGQKSNMPLSRLKSRCLLGCVFSGGSWEESVSQLIQILGSLPGATLSS